ncbi:anthranilate synthase component II [Aliidiomarina sanyensis]|uniref:Aminodeoxychorismate/anthranilate synthase component II n=1 Tax=Aliidiomarina sanyensis TaxID=1249555 RepID=A0A432WK68_9GAMM|nr:aminodeoxychorismate/anthranilate synthase component II [Aliidiomarina sanyensis]RUO34164.1 aminodeoxychorismate/anthranilate synthase component II [Aliidiomarina sanyensis]
MILFIDNYDSFTHNLARYFRELGQDVRVVRNDELTVDEMASLQPEALVISPGPCTPNEAGVSLAAIAHFATQIPILGVCLGHQAIGQVFGGQVVRAAQVMHGKRSWIAHDDSALFERLPSCFEVVRYHSLVLEPSTMPACLEVNAWVSEALGDPKEPRVWGEIMALSHKTLPIYGVQFHPESVLSRYGHEILENFCGVVDQFWHKNSDSKRINSQREQLPSA